MVFFIFSLCLESLKFLQLAVYPSHCYVAHVNKHEVYRQVSGPWSAHGGRQDLEGRTVGKRGPERGKLQSILVFLTKSQSLYISAHSQEYQCSFIWTFIDITLKPISPKQNSLLCAWKCVHSHSSPMWVFHWGHQASWSVQNTPSLSGVLSS